MHSQLHNIMHVALSPMNTSETLKYNMVSIGGCTDNVHTICYMQLYSRSPLPNNINNTYVQSQLYKHTHESKQYIKM